MDQLLKFINNLNKSQRIILVSGFALLFIIVVGFLIYSSIKAEDKKLNYTIASNLTQADVMRASEELEASGIQFVVSGSGNNLTLKTSQEFINIAKIKLVTSEAATNKHVGWEIFEKSSLGTTNFENKVKYLRALEGELSRSLESLSGVLKANVKIAIPKETIFTEKRADTTASAVISLKQGIHLTKKQIDGIKNFIASAVPDLKQENIQLIDQDGNLLEQNIDEENTIKSAAQNKYKDKIEKDYEAKIISLLEPVVGTGRVVAKVNVALDFVKKDVEEEIYSPEGSIRSQQVIENTNNTQGMLPNNGGVAGVDNNIQVPTTVGDGSKISSNSEGSNTVTNYEISRKVISQKDGNYTNIKRITASVTFDSAILKDHPDKGEFIASLESLSGDAIGYDRGRGDTITVKDFKFVGAKALNENGQLVDEFGNVINSGDGISVVGTMSTIKSILQDYKDYIQYLIVGILLFVFYKKFIASSDIVILGDGNKKKLEADDGDIVKEMLTNYESEFDTATAQGRLKSKVKSQILNNIEGLDEESAAKYEVFIEELDREINNSPAEMARMIELLLSEGNANFK
ncbi:flagellar basal-body MS-ring/collar protein FliF [Aliarcobacter butzleri]|uniref:Flagellar M-ring protein n=1 Tax=Aliarcobacter butzleri TaxID=28197 RepID=A0AAW6VRE3_9BACT|nr:flagellar basal-body MS-ring/collar protein FliF [Aliarcobacter butzleri]MCT7582169.1 flagellar basal-body MS-ring/collar protein FliF [Aliarcobacter butzleri]MDK2062950.1 flagellar basal-body MS-ring/collar protein FliF [Aliarcobacter butzleri]MDK2070900.1 flagellar basal-body MS-ring/collar protein FliF [Aliarcobacter butzleri]MDN5078190.1 flagellar basal-body MS-ring/collar protein FliF [Aliarcobacter butzleri]MDN5119506.1 flagellar basal-body MS-ring/collar protein FliF [Aliarcobacter b